MEGDDAVDRSICCRRQLSADSRRSNGKPGIVAVALPPLALVAFATCQLDVLLIGMDIFWNKQVRKFSYNTSMFYVSYYFFQYNYFVTNTII